MNNTNTLSESLNNRNIFSVCYTGIEDLESFHSELYQLRKNYYIDNQKKLDKSGEYFGYPSKTKGKIGRHNFQIKKIANKVRIYESFIINKSYVVIVRDLNSRINQKIYFDRSLLWLKTEYFQTDDHQCASVILKPVGTKDAVEIFTYNQDSKNYNSQLLYPVPYLHSTAEQSILNARHGDDMVLISTLDGEFCYCAEEEQKNRLASLDEINKGTIMLMPAWEVKSGEIPESAIIGKEPVVNYEEFLSEPQKEEVNSETAEEIIAINEPEILLKPTKEDNPIPPCKNTKEEIIEEVNKTIMIEAEAETSDSKDLVSEESTIIVQDETVALIEPRFEGVTPAVVDNATPPLEQEDLTVIIDNPVEIKEDSIRIETVKKSGLKFTGNIVSGKRVGRGRTEQENGLTVFDGEYADNKRIGFGSSYYKNGDVSYVGGWKDDKKDGLGISFRSSDHAVNIAKWTEGKPDEFTTLFDQEGNLRFSGRIVDGKKEGVGISFRKSDSTVFVGKWQGGNACNSGSLFDSNGNLIYTGGFENGMRNGTGTEFDDNGQIVYSGEWKDDKYLNGILYQKI